MQVRTLEEQLRSQHAIVVRLQTALDAEILQHGTDVDASKARISALNSELARLRVAHHRLKDDQREQSMRSTAHEVLVNDLFDKANMEHLMGAGLALCCLAAVLNSEAVLAEVLLKSPRKLLIFIIKTYRFRIKVSEITFDLLLKKASLVPKLATLIR